LDKFRRFGCTAPKRRIQAVTADCEGSSYFTLFVKRSLEAQLQAEIERLRAQELHREVCVLLFFRHAITPTANRLY
jgi:hypothetical protein